MRGLEIGPGTDRLGPGWETLNLVPGSDHVAEWGAEPLPFPDDAFDVVYACHVIEHVPWWMADAAFAEAFRVLKPGGMLELHTVDFSVLVASYLSKRPADGWTCGGRNPGLDPMKWIASKLFSYGRSQVDPQWHRNCFDADSLGSHFERAGFVRVERVTEPRRGENHGPVNLGMRGVKP